MAVNAVRKLMLSIVVLMVSGAAVFAATKSIYDAIRDNDILAVDEILRESRNAALESKIAAGITPLHFAAALNRKVILGMLLSRGADRDARSDKGFTALHWAASRDAAEAAQILIDFGADVNLPAVGGITPLHWAASKDATNVVKRLIAAGANVTAETDKGLTPLDWAVKKGRNDAAVIISYHAVSEQMEMEAESPGEGPLPDEVEDMEPVIEGPENQAGETAVSDADQDTDADKPDGQEPGPEEVAAVLPRPEFGKALNVSLGFNESLKFVWLDDLKIWFGKYEVTNGQYKRFKKKHRSMFRDEFTLEGDDQPVVHVSWNDAKAYCDWLNKEYSDYIPLDCEFRLPLASEWTAAAKCGDDRKYPWGDKWPPVYGNYFDLTGRRNIRGGRGVKNYDDGWIVTSPVGQSGSNEWGIFGLAGNVWEWCEDWYGSDLKHKVRRGGSWYFDTRESLEVDVYGFDRPESHDDTIGFRLVIDKAGK